MHAWWSIKLYYYPLSDINIYAYSYHMSVWVYAGCLKVDSATCRRCNTVPEEGRVEDGMLST
jgi:hypothetical protein